MQLVPSDQDEAKDCFLRFCACRGNVPTGAFFSRLYSVCCGLTMQRAALATLKVMISAPGFSPKLLQWAYKLAAEQNDKDLTFAITELLCEVCQAPEVAAQLDYMVLTRCGASSSLAEPGADRAWPCRSVIRQHVVRLQDKDAPDALKYILDPSYRANELC